MAILSLLRIDSIHAINPVVEPRYPRLHEELCVFLQLSGYRGPGTGRVEIHHADSETQVFRSPTHPLPARPDPLEVHGLIFRLRDTYFTASGLYWVRFWYNDSMLAQQPLLLR